MKTYLLPQTRSATAPFLAGKRSGLVRRKCACGKEIDSGGECEDCKRKRQALQNSIGNWSDQAAVPPVVYEVLRSPGQPLDSATRAFVESRFGHDFGKVRVHTDAQAAESARAVNAVAYTVGQSIVFGTGQFRPYSAEGRHLIAHELAHTIQQSTVSASDLRIQDDSLAETEAQNAALAVNLPFSIGRYPKRLTPISTTAIQRKVVVNNPAASPKGAPAGVTNEAIVRDYVTKLCPSFTVTAGELVPISSGFCPAGPLASPALESCSCLCTMHTLASPGTSTPIIWHIAIDDTAWPQTDPGSKTVKVHSPFSGIQFGAWSKGPSSHRITETGWRTLGHELCGHGKLFATGTHPTGPPPRAGGRPEHDPTVTIENKIVAEHGLPPTELRGLFADPHHGESFAKITIEGFPKNSPFIAALPPAQKSQIDKAERFIKSADIKLDIIGHSDRGPQPVVDQFAALERAKNMKTELSSRRIDPRRFLTVSGVGSLECALPGDQPSCRKVDIFMFSREGASVTKP